MKTPIQTLYGEIISDPIFTDLPMDFIKSLTSKFVKALDKEREVIEKSYDSGDQVRPIYCDGSDYYNKTYTLQLEGKPSDLKTK